jgi:hypothetical protein
MLPSLGGLLLLYLCLFLLPQMCLIASMQVL